MLGRLEIPRSVASRWFLESRWMSLQLAMSAQERAFVRVGVCWCASLVLPIGDFVEAIHPCMHFTGPCGMTLVMSRGGLRL